MANDSTHTPPSEGLHVKVKTKAEVEAEAAKKAAQPEPAAPAKKEEPAREKEEDTARQKAKAAEEARVKKIEAQGAAAVDKALPDQAVKDAAEHTRQAFGAVGETMKTGAQVTHHALAHPDQTAEDVKHGAEGFLDSFKKMNTGGWVGGLLGVFGAWLVSTAFGGGPLGMVAMLCLIPMGFLLGRQAGNGTLNDWLHNMFGKKDHTAPNPTPAVASPSPQPEAKSLEDPVVQDIMNTYRQVQAGKPVGYSFRPYDGEAVSPNAVPSAPARAYDSALPSH